MAAPPVHTLPGYDENGPWFYNSSSGKLEYSPNGIGWLSGILITRLPTNWYGFKTQADAVSAGSTEGWPAPTTSTSKAITNDATGLASGAASSVLGLPTLSNTRDLVSRGVRVVGGLMLLFVGLNMLAKDTVNVDVMSAVKAIPK